MPRPSLTKRGLLWLVAVPFLDQLVFVIVLIVLLTGVQTEMVKQSQANQMINSFYQMLSQVAFDIYTQQTTKLANKEPQLSDEVVSDDVKRTTENWNGAIGMAKSNIRHKETIEKLESIKRSVNEAIKRARNTNQTEAQKAEGDTLVVNQCIELVDHLKKMEDVDEEIAQESPVKSRELRTAIKASLGVAIGISVLAALLLARLFANSINKPLARITENSWLLSERKPLLEPLPDSDELGKLDGLLHQVSNEVTNALNRELELVNNADELICSLDRDGVFTSVNPFVKTMLGKEPDAVIGKPLLAFVLAEDCVVTDDKLKVCRVTPGTNIFESRLVRSDGRNVDTKWYAFWSEEQQSLFCVVNDVTEQKNLERMKQDFINMVSHDLRSPLMSMHGSMELIAAGAKGPVPDTVKSEVLEAARSIRLLTDLVTDLLDFQKFQAGKMVLDPSRLNLRDTIMEAADMIHSVAQRKEIEIIVADNQLNIRADRSKLRQAILNLLSNAVKFSPKSGTIRVNITDEADLVEISVIDQGPGIPEQYQEKIFEAFEQVPSSDKKKDGSGLGLAICKLIAVAHGGSIGMHNKLSDDGTVTGSNFWIRIPK